MPTPPCARKQQWPDAILGRQGHSEDKCLGVQVEAAFVGVLVLPKVQAPVLSDEVVVADADYEVVLPRTLRVDRRECYRLPLFVLRQEYTFSIHTVKLAAVENFDALQRGPCCRWRKDKRLEG